MKKYAAVFIALLLISANLIAQDRIPLRPKDRLIIGVFTDMWSDLPSNMDTRTINRGVSIDYVQEFPLGASNFSVAAGLGFASHNLYSDNFYMRNFDNNRFDFMPIEDVEGDVDYSNNKLSLNYLNVPLEVRFRTRNTPKTFRIHAGVKAGLLVNAHTKYVGESAPNDRDTKLKEGKLDNIETFMLGFHGRIGYGRVNLNTFISLTDIFEGNNAQSSGFMSLGLSFIIF